jgi:hypothetical protein
MRSRISWSAALLVVGAVAPIVTASPAASEGPIHQVRYTVTSESPWDVKIYYHDTEPPDYATYSHNPYVYTPRADVHVAPGQSWVLDVGLVDPDLWAMVVASTEFTPVTPNLGCTLEVDGVVVKTAKGPKGALCSIRSW